MKSNFQIKKLTLAMSILGLAACGGGSSGSSSDFLSSMGAQTAPSLSVAPNSAYTDSTNIQARSLRSTGSTDQWTALSQNFQAKQDSIQNLRTLKSGDSYPEYSQLADYNAGNTYASGGNVVRFSDGERFGVFTNKWWTQGDTPNFDSQSGPWELVARVNSDGSLLSKEESTDTWIDSAVYNGGDTVLHDGKYFEAKYWTRGDTPILTISSGGTADDWSTPWKYVGEDLADGGEIVIPDPIIPDPVVPVEPVDPGTDSGTDNGTDTGTDNGTDSGTNGGTDNGTDTGTDGGDNGTDTGTDNGTDNGDGTDSGTDNGTVEPVEPITPPDLGNNGLPEEGYEFLSELTDEHWDWFFPMRSGRYNPQGGYRNIAPYAAEDGSLDTFNLASFKAAVVEYNAWAESKGYKQFLNEGSKEQQALEFTTFIAKSARETSGSWDTATSPWAEDDPVVGKVWKGALYWVEEVGYSTDANGVSEAINYVDHASTAYPPVAGRSYYGRGLIQLSWNYNYGAFSYWLYDNGLMSDVITERDMLLKRPDYVATNGTLSIMSGIWFWMTPQGAKPSSHDVMYGEMTHVSTSSQDEGLPQRNSNNDLDPEGAIPTYIPVAAGHSTKQDVIAYRIGTVINIVNGGLECNFAAGYHDGPNQRISYYNAFGTYINSQIGTNITIIEDAYKNGAGMWTEKVEPTSPENVKLATCYAQKSYYGW